MPQKNHHAEPELSLVEAALVLTALTTLGLAALALIW